jgi:hypothetical protein
MCKVSNHHPLLKAGATIPVRSSFFEGVPKGSTYLHATQTLDTSWYRVGSCDFNIIHAFVLKLDPNQLPSPMLQTQQSTSMTPVLKFYTQILHGKLKVNVVNPPINRGIPQHVQFHHIRIRHYGAMWIHSSLAQGARHINTRPAVARMHRLGQHSVGDEFGNAKLAGFLLPFTPQKKMQKI